MENRKNTGSGEIFICVLLLFMCLIFSFVMEYGFLLEKVSLFKDKLNTAMEDCITKSAEKSLYELRRNESIKSSLEDLKQKFAEYNIEGFCVRELETAAGSGISVEGVLLLPFNFCGREAFTAQIPFSEQKIYENVEAKA